MDVPLYLKKKYDKIKLKAKELFFLFYKISLKKLIKKNFQQKSDNIKSI